MSEKRKKLEGLFKKLDRIESRLANGKFKSNDLLEYMRIKRELRDFGVKYLPISEEERRSLLERVG